MSLFEDMSDSSISIPRTVLNYALMSTLLLSATQETEARNQNSTPIVCPELMSNSSLFGSSLPASQDGSDNDSITHEQVANSLMTTLASHGLIADRRHETADKSILLEFLTGTRACVDIYPTGEIVVIVRENGCDNVFELGIANTGRIIELVRDGLGK